jgi:hypothetical protein
MLLFICLLVVLLVPVTSRPFDQLTQYDPAVEVCGRFSGADRCQKLRLSWNVSEYILWSPVQDTEPAEYTVRFEHPSPIWLICLTSSEQLSFDSDLHDIGDCRDGMKTRTLRFEPSPLLRSIHLVFFGGVYRSKIGLTLVTSRIYTVPSNAVFNPYASAELSALPVNTTLVRTPRFELYGL